MKVEYLIKTLQELPKGSEVFSLMYFMEDAHFYSDVEVTEKEWQNVVEKMQSNDHIDEEINNQFRYYVDKEIEKRDNKNENK
jgi:hypothetical protein